VSVSQCLALALLAFVVVADGPMMTRRLLLSGGGGGSFTSPPLSPPTDDSWARVGGNPVMSPTGWEGTWILEPSVLYEGGLFKMIYTGNGGTNAAQFGYATSTDGLSWTRSGSNPIWGMGAGGQNGYVNQPELLKVGSTYYMYYSDGSYYKNVATSTDLVSWSNLATNILSNPDGQTKWNNVSVRIDPSGTWQMLAEGLKAGIYLTYYWTSTDGVIWTAGNGGAALTTLRVAVGGTYGGPFLWPTQIGGLWHVWYHASPAAGNLPTNIYHATSPDFITWTQTTPNPILSYGGAAFEVDQVADPSIITRDGTAYLFYNGAHNTGSGFGSIGLATAPGG